MRISNNMMVDRALMDIQNNLGRLDRTQTDISTGKRIHRPSDDPTSNARAMVLRTNLDKNAQYQKNIDSAKNVLSVTDTAITSVVGVMQRIRQLAVQGQNGNLRQEDRDAIVHEVTQLRDQLRDLGNTQVNGRFIFGGLKTDSQPYPSDVTLSPNDNGNLSVEVGAGITIDYNVTGVQLYGNTTPPGTNHLFDAIDEFVGFLKSGTNTTDISDTTLTRLDGYLKSIGDLRTDVGGKLNRLDMANSRMDDQKVSLEGLLNDTENTDIAKATLQLNQYQASFQAALSVGARSIPMSLVDYLR